MKKIIFIMILSLSAAFFACGDDEVTTLRWDNKSGKDVKDIQWIGFGDVRENQTWVGETLDGEGTAYREITKLAGSGVALIDTGSGNLDTEADIRFPDLSYNAVILENTDATLVIDDATP